MSNPILPRYQQWRQNQNTRFKGTFRSVVLLMIILCIDLSTCINGWPSNNLRENSAHLGCWWMEQRTGQIPRWGWQTLWIDQARWRMAGANVVVGWCHHGATSSHHHHPLRTSSKDLTSPPSIIFTTTIIFSSRNYIGLHSGCFFPVPHTFQYTKGKLAKLIRVVFNWNFLKK